jgi:hypothetical protein
MIREFDQVTQPSALIDVITVSDGLAMRKNTASSAVAISKGNNPAIAIAVIILLFIVFAERCE